MSTEKTGGHAFPDFLHDGMTLRDYFAAQAMMGIQARVNWSVDDVAEIAYKQADAMLEARK
jgi:hypothetical protein